MAFDEPSNGNGERRRDTLDLVVEFGKVRDHLDAGIRELRNEQRQGLADHETRMTAALALVREDVAEAKQDMRDFAIGHIGEHERETEEKRRAHERYDLYIAEARLERARRQGAIGVFLTFGHFVVTHGKVLIGLLFALAGFLGVVLGHVRVEVGAL